MGKTKKARDKNENVVVSIVTYNYSTESYCTLLCDKLGYRATFNIINGLKPIPKSYTFLDVTRNEYSNKDGVKASVVNTAQTLTYLCELHKVYNGKDVAYDAKDNVFPNILVLEGPMQAVEAALEDICNAVPNATAGKMFVKPKEKQVSEAQFKRELNELKNEFQDFQKQINGRP